MAIKHDRICSEAFRGLFSKQEQIEAAWSISKEGKPATMMSPWERITDAVYKNASCFLILFESGGGAFALVFLNSKCVVVLSVLFKLV